MNELTDQLALGAQPSEHLRGEAGQIRRQWQALMDELNRHGRPPLRSPATVR
jgi:hypothetical protein